MSSEPVSRAELQALADKVDKLVQLFRGLQVGTTRRLGHLAPLSKWWVPLQLRISGGLGASLFRGWTPRIIGP